MNKPDYRWIYLVYIVVFCVLALWLNEKYKFTDTTQNTASFIANTSELLGLAIALTEIIFLTHITKNLKKSVDSLRSYSDISDTVVFLSQIKEDLLSKKYGKAILRLEKVREVYQENLIDGELNNVSSIHRTNFDKINSMILTLTIAESNFSTLQSADLKDHLSFLIAFNETVISLKLTFKDLIL